jgi:hypothetical protein
MLRPTVFRPVFLGVKPHLGPKSRFLLLSDSCGFVNVGRPFWREDGSVVYNCCWSSPAKSFLGPSPVGLMIIFYCLRFETSPTWRGRSPYLYPPGTGWPSYTPRHWVPFSSPPSTRRDTVEVFEATSTRGVNFTTGGLPPISLCWRQAPWDSRPEYFSATKPFRPYPCVTSSLTRGWDYLLGICLAFVKCMYHTYSISLHCYAECLFFRGSGQSD